MDYISVPHFQELSVKRLWLDLKQDSKFNIYFNDEFPEEKVPNREYFYNILNTIYPDYLKSIMAHASKERYAVDGEVQKIHTIEATQEWEDELKNMPFKSSKSNIPNFYNFILLIGKNGKFVHLLKKKSKTKISRKKRKVINILGSIKDYRASVVNSLLPPGL